MTGPGYNGLHSVCLAIQSSMPLPRPDPGGKGWRLRGVEAGLRFAARFQLGNAATEIEQLGWAALLRKLGAEGGCGRLIHTQVFLQHNAVAFCPFPRHQSPVHVGRDFVGRTFQRIAPAAAPTARRCTS